MTNTQENPLVTKYTPDNGPITGMGDPKKGTLDNLTSTTGGAGLFNDAAATLNDFRSGDWVNAGLDVATDALDLLGAAMDPLGTLAGAGVGWLIEHIGFLKEGLDKLAGDPGAVTAKAQTWTNISKQLTEAASLYDGQAAKLTGSYDGTSATQYQKTAKSYSDTLRAASDHANGASTALTVGAALVGTERGLIRDLISSFVGQLIIKAVAALATSWCSFGASVAVFITDTVLEGAALAEKIGTRIAKIVEKLTKLAESAGKSKGAIEAASKALQKVGTAASKIADKGLNAAAKMDAKARDLQQAAKDAKEVTADGLKDSFKAHTTDKAMEKMDQAKEAAKNKLGMDEGWSKSIQDKLTGQGSVGEKYSESGRSALNPEEWQKAAEHARKDGYEMRPPGWNTADTIGVGAEARRQENEQIDRSNEAQAKYNEEHPQKAGAEG